MRNRIVCLAVASLFGTGLWVAGQPQTKNASLSADSSRDADRKAILQSARDYTDAFEKGDAKALAVLWTEQGEYESDDGTILRGRSAIEAGMAAHFKDHPSEKMEIKVENVRFLSRDAAVEEGMTVTTSKDMWPSSAFYLALHVREDGKWRIAFSSEWGAAENRMADLEWLIGTWQSHEKGQELTVSFARDKDLPLLVGEFKSTVDGKSVPLGTMRIGVDAATGEFHSWHFDPDGGFGQGAWLMERNHWIVDSRGQRGDGTPTAAVNLLSRLGRDEVGWRSLDRMVGGQPQPDSPLIRLKRVDATK
jgi:uncharacterized protein (TIGR02246 family)